VLARIAVPSWACRLDGLANCFLWGNRLARHRRVWVAKPLRCVSSHSRRCTILPTGWPQLWRQLPQPGGALLLTAVRWIASLPSIGRRGRITKMRGRHPAADILQLTVPAGWFLRSSQARPPLRSGALIANDVQARIITGRNLWAPRQQFELLRSDGQRLTCSPSEHGLFWGDHRRSRIDGPHYLRAAAVATHPGSGWIWRSSGSRISNEFFRLSEVSTDFEYTVAWIDCLSRGRSSGTRSVPAGQSFGSPMGTPKVRRGTWPCPSWPFSLVNTATLRLFNFCTIIARVSGARRREHFRASSFRWKRG